MLMVSLGGNTTSTLILTIQSPLQTVTEIFNNWVRQRSLAKFRQISRKMQLAQSLSPTRTWSPIWNLSLKFSLTWVSRSKKQLLRVLLLPLLLSENKFRLKSKRAQLSPPWLINSSKFFFIISIFFYFEFRYAIKTCWASTAQQIRDTVDATGAAGTDGTDDDDGKF